MNSKRSGRRPLWVALGLLSVMVLGWVGYRLPHWQLQTAWEEHLACKQRLQAGQLGCEGALRPPLRLSLWAPWTREAASSQLRLALVQESELLLAHYATREVDRRRRKEAALRFVRAQRAFGTKPLAIVSELESRAAWDVLRDAPELWQGVAAPRGLFRALVQRGEFARATELAQHSDPSDGLTYWHVERGAWLCLQDRKGEAMAAFAKQAQLTPDFRLLRRARAVCSGETQHLKELQSEVEWADGLLVHSSPRSSYEHLLPRSDEPVRRFTTPFFADWLLEHADNLEAVVHQAAQAAQSTTHLPEDGVVDSVRLLAAADKLSTFRKRAPARYPPMQPHSPSHVPYWGHAEIEAARTAPRETLELAEHNLRLHATLGYRATSDAEGFRAALAALPRFLRRQHALSLASVALGAGAWKEADTLASQLRDDASSGEQIVALLLRADLHFQRGELPEAAQLAARAEQALRKAEGDKGAPPLVMRGYSDDVAWVQAAVALATESKQAARRVALPEGVWTGRSGAENLPQDWFSLALADISVRRAARARFRRLWNPSLRVPTSQAFVVAWVGRDGDAELWLDQMLRADRQGALQSRLLEARAGAARARGDDQAAAAWSRRARQLRQLVSTPRQAVLAHALGM